MTVNEGYTISRIILAGAPALLIGWTLYRQRVTLRAGRIDRQQKREMRRYLRRTNAALRADMHTAENIAAAMRQKGN